MLNSRRLYLNSVDTDTTYTNQDGRVNFDLSKAHINCGNNQYLALSLVRCQLPATCAIQSTACGEYPTYNVANDDCNLVLAFQFWRSSVKQGAWNIPFNARDPNLVTTYGASYPLTLQSTINDMVYIINDVVGETVIKIDDATTTLGLFRLIMINTDDYIIFWQVNSSDEVLRALGVYNNQNTTVTSTTASPYNFDMSQVLPTIRLKTNLNFNSASSTSTGDSSILDSIPCALNQGNQYFELIASGPLNIKNKSVLIHENTYMAKNVIQDKSLQSLNIELLSKDNKKITTGQQPFSIVIQIDTLDSL